MSKLFCNCQNQRAKLNLLCNNISKKLSIMLLATMQAEKSKYNYMAKYMEKIKAFIYCILTDS